MKNQRLLERKLELKELTKKIREDKRAHGSPSMYSDSFRYSHIAYCMARGRSYEQIENKVHEHNVISDWRWESINKDIEYLREGFNEDVCVSA